MPLTAYAALCPGAELGCKVSERFQPGKVDEKRMHLCLGPSLPFLLFHYHTLNLVGFFSGTPKFSRTEIFLYLCKAEHCSFFPGLHSSGRWVVCFSSGLLPV